MSTGAAAVVWDPVCGESRGGGGTVRVSRVGWAHARHYHGRQRHLAVWWQGGLQELLQPEKNCGVLQVGPWFLTSYMYIKRLSDYS